MRTTAGRLPRRALKHIFHLPLFASIHATECPRNNACNDDQRYIGEVEWCHYEAWKVIGNSRYMRKSKDCFNLPADKIRYSQRHPPAAFQAEKIDPAVRQRFAAPGEKPFLHRAAGPGKRGAAAPRGAADDPG